MDEQVKALISEQLKIKDFLINEHLNTTKLNKENRNETKAAKIFKKINPFYRNLVNNNNILNTLVTTDEERDVIRKLFEEAQVEFIATIKLLNAMNPEIPLVSTRVSDVEQDPKQTPKVTEATSDANDNKLDFGLNDFIPASTASEPNFNLQISPITSLSERFSARSLAASQSSPQMTNTVQEDFERRRLEKQQKLDEDFLKFQQNHFLLGASSKTQFMLPPFPHISSATSYHPVQTQVSSHSQQSDFAGNMNGNQIPSRNSIPAAQIFTSSSFPMNNYQSNANFGHPIPFNNTLSPENQQMQVDQAQLLGYQAQINAAAANQNAWRFHQPQFDPTRMPPQQFNGHPLPMSHQPSNLIQSEIPPKSQASQMIAAANEDSTQATPNQMEEILRMLVQNQIKQNEAFSNRKREFKTEKLSQIREFNGDLQDYNGFRKMFENVTNAMDMTTFQKFTALQNKLKGVAFDSIRSLTLDEANYDTAWLVLERQFNNNFVAHEYHLNVIRDLPMTDAQKRSDYLSFTQKYQSAIHNLAALGLNIDKCESLLLCHILQRMDTKTRSNFLKHAKNGTDQPTIKQLNEFFEEEQTIHSALLAAQTTKGSN